MMREVTCDDGNGDSTFEFVEEKFEGLSIENESVETDVVMSGGTMEKPAHQMHPALTMTTSSVTSPLSSTIPPTVHPTQAHVVSSDMTHSVGAQGMPLQATLQQAPVRPPFPGAPQFNPMQNVAPSSDMGFRYPNQNLYRMPSSPLTSASVVQTQPVTMYPVSPTISTSIDLPVGAEQPNIHPFSPSGSSEEKGSFLGWIKETVTGNDFLSKVAEKAKNSMDSVITTLDPQMKQYIHSGGDIDVVVASDKDVKIESIREGFQVVFGRASVRGLAAQANIAQQPVGFAAGLQGAEERIQYLRQTGLLHNQQTIIAIENFIIELTPERWYDIGCLVLNDPVQNLILHSYTLPMPVPIQAVQQAQDETPADYPLRWSGLAIPIGKVISHMFQIPHTQWHEILGCVPRREAIFQAARVLASQYKRHLMR